MSQTFGTILGMASLAAMNAQGMPFANHNMLTVTMCTADGREVAVEIPIDSERDREGEENCATACHAMCKRSRDGPLRNGTGT